MITIFIILGYPPIGIFFPINTGNFFLTPKTVIDFCFWIEKLVWFVFLFSNHNRRGRALLLEQVFVFLFQFELDSKFGVYFEIVGLMPVLPIVVCSGHCCFPFFILGFSVFYFSLLNSSEILFHSSIFSCMICDQF